MIDFINCDLSFYNQKHYNNNPLFQFKSIVNKETGEISDREWAEVHQMKVIRGPNYHRMKGSLHHFWKSVNNQPITNHDDFTFVQIFEAIDLLEVIFKIEIFKVKLSGLEFGFNISSLLPTKKVIDAIVLFDQNKAKIKEHDYKNKGYGKHYKLSQQELKIYDKSIQQNLKSHLIRIELKFIKAQILKRLGIDTLSDLKNKTVYPALIKQYIKMYDSLIILESSNTDHMQALEKEIFVKGLALDRLKFKHRQEKKRLKDKFQQIITKYNLNRLQVELRKSIGEKYEQLICDGITNYSSKIHINKMVTNLPTIILEKRELVTVLPLVIDEKRHMRYESRYSTKTKNLQLNCNS